MPIGGFSWLGLAFAAAVPLVFSAAPSAIPFTDDAGRPHQLSDLAGRPAVLVFWRSDCGPCLIELKSIGRLQDAARPARLITIAVQPRGTALPAAARLKLPAGQAWTAQGDPAAVLTAFNGPPPRLPLAIAITAKGQVCDRRLGLLGTDRVAEWAHRC